MQGISILGAPETAFSHFPGKAVIENPLVANGHATLVAGVQVSIRHCCPSYRAESHIRAFVLQFRSMSENTLLCTGQERGSRGSGGVCGHVQQCLLHSGGL